MERSVIVLGAGMVGVSVALHLRRRGYHVALVDRQRPGLGASFGNGGRIQTEAVFPAAFPRGMAKLRRIARNRSVDVAYHPGALPGPAGSLCPGQPYRTKLMRGPIWWLRRRRFVSHALTCAFFALWVSVCAFAPEAIWQGFRLLREHFGMAEGLTALFLGAILSFFVDPLSERLKARRWHSPHPSNGRALLTVPVALFFGAATVCIHEAMTAFLGAAHAHDGGERLSHAVGDALQWACVPAAVTVAWFAAAGAPRAALPAAVLTAAWAVGAGYLFGWRPVVVVTTALPAFVLALLGARLTARRWDEGTFPALARLTASVAVTWLALLCLVRFAADLLGWRMSELYETAQVLEDLRFYLGWSLGVMLAPDPVWRQAPPLARA